MLTKAYADVVRGWNWKSFTVLYEDEEGLMRLQDVIQLSTTPIYKVIVRQLPESDDYRYKRYKYPTKAHFKNMFECAHRPLLKEMKKMGERNIVLDCSQLSRIEELLKQAQQVGMTTLAQSYFITNLVI